MPPYGEPDWATPGDTNVMATSSAGLSPMTTGGGAAAGVAPTNANTASERYEEKLQNSVERHKITCKRESHVSFLSPRSLAASETIAPCAHAHKLSSSLTTRMRCLLIQKQCSMCRIGTESLEFGLGGHDGRIGRAQFD
jgi:hypothetical protein